MFLKQTISKLSRIRKIFERPFVAHERKQGFQTKFNFLPKVLFIMFSFTKDVSNVHFRPFFHTVHMS